MIYLLFVGAVYYVTRILLFDHKEEPSGPLPDTQKRVRHVFLAQEGAKRQVYEAPVQLFDYVRRIFGLYDIQRDTGAAGAIWLVRESHLAVWTCALCLGFWVALILAPIWILIFNHDPREFLFLVLAGAGWNHWMVSYVAR